MNLILWFILIIATSTISFGIGYMVGYWKGVFRIQEIEAMKKEGGAHES